MVDFYLRGSIWFGRKLAASGVYVLGRSGDVLHAVGNNTEPSGVEIARFMKRRSCSTMLVMYRHAKNRLPASRNEAGIVQAAPSRLA